jgi:hypothetical protein
MTNKLARLRAAEAHAVGVMRNEIARLNTERNKALDDLHEARLENVQLKDLLNLARTRLVLDETSIPWDLINEIERFVRIPPP